MPPVPTTVPPFDLVPLLTVDELTISVRGARLVDSVSLSVAQGERVALLGASGSGKSLTAAAVLGGLGGEFRVGGRVSILGSAVDPHTPRGRAGLVAAVSQDSRAALNPLVKIGPQLSIPLAGRTGMRRRTVRGLAEELLLSVGIEDPARALAGYAAELSGGQRQRVCIALALACQARLLIADEPTTALDVVNQARVIAVLRRYGIEHRAATLFITHDLPLAATFCDRAVVLQHGRVVEQGTMAELIERPRHAYTRALVDSAARETDAGAVPAACAGDCADDIRAA